MSTRTPSNSSVDGEATPCFATFMCKHNQLCRVSLPSCFKAVTMPFTLHNNLYPCTNNYFFLPTSTPTPPTWAIGGDGGPNVQRTVGTLAMGVGSSKIATQITITTISTIYSSSQRAKDKRADVAVDRRCSRRGEWSEEACLLNEHRLALETTANCAASAKVIFLSFLLPKASGSKL